MIPIECMLNRRNFLRGSIGMAAGLSTVLPFPNPRALRIMLGSSGRNPALHPKLER